MFHDVDSLNVAYLVEGDLDRDDLAVSRLCLDVRLSRPRRGGDRESSFFLSPVSGKFKIRYDVFLVVEGHFKVKQYFRGTEL